MRIIKYVMLLTLFYGASVMASIPEPVHSFPLLPFSYREARLNEITEALEQRALFLLKGRQFQPFSLNKTDAAILKEFEQINDWRFQAWYMDPLAKILVSRPDFVIAQDLLEKKYFRHPKLIAFQFNQTDGSYNSSTLILNGFKFLALEAPTAKNVQSFFTLLKNQMVTQLVRLTPALENGQESSFNYWSSKLKTNTKTKETFLNIPQEKNPVPYPVSYYAIDTWLEDKGIDPKTLLKLIQSVKAKHDKESNLLACHDRLGGGRTGTFLVGFVLIAEIDKQMAAGIQKKALEISIEKMVMQLSLQRAYLISTKAQYLTLYRLVDLYLSTLKDPKTPSSTEENKAPAHPKNQ